MDSSDQPGPTPDITFYRVDGSCAQVPHAILQHLGIPFTEVVMVKDDNDKYVPADGSMTHAEYRARINPDGYVPSLVVDGNPITEIPAIM